MKRTIFLLLLALLMMGCAADNNGSDDIETADTNESGCVTDAIRNTEDGDTAAVADYVFPASTLQEAYVVRPTDHYKGGPDPDFILIEYGDFQCPACRAFSPVGSAIVQRYEENFGIIFRHFPLTHIHPYAHKAAQASEAAAEQGKFWAYHDAVFSCQQNLGQLGQQDADDLLKNIAADIGLDMTAFEKAYDDEVYAEYVDQMIAEATAIGVNATPSGIVQPYGADVILTRLSLQETWWRNTIEQELSNRGIEQ